MVALLDLSSWCLVVDVWLFLAVPWVKLGLSQFMIVRNMFPLSEPHILYARFRVVPTVSVVWFTHILVINNMKHGNDEAHLIL